jgi:hypothetical protein
MEISCEVGRVPKLWRYLLGKSWKYQKIGGNLGSTKK